MRIILLVLLLVFIGCSSTKLVKDFEEQEVPESIQALDDFENETEDTLNVRKSARGKLAYARNIMKIGDYEAAIETYEQVYSDSLFEPGHRAEALYRLGMIFESSLYDNKDYEKAIYYYKIIIKEFSISEFRLDAFRRSEALKTKLEEDE
ncbi:MAG: tetratricopeptide repeat protein [Candidatus Cloacimonetes bacterium]|nr:tetratricopeptide repeat protein [Candidatus Cloacimonadota bacterium]MBL7149289.1 tetratricopeptide repeat protein [Candidatus Cloacimonadota bacterium]